VCVPYLADNTYQVGRPTQCGVRVRDRELHYY
jgi:hypothetical protein